ncbi:uncharacterized protein LOC127080220 [Lathyrus oleraceus]|uniref:uncharacterized protein LOC127080220 n=1 Tax=Pisum sativum TaxID=3888 RepID=UPI0021D3DAAC|nr:uncharacterized protein LOC127080220 [Pisum sativum]
MTEKKDMATPQALPPKMKDPKKFTITSTTVGVKIPHALCDLGLIINVISLNKFKEFKIGEIIPSNMTLTLADSSITHLLSIVQDMLVHVDGLIFPGDFMVINMKGESRGSVIIGLLFLVTRKTLIDVETGELVLKFNTEKVVYNAYEWTIFMVDL